MSDLFLCPGAQHPDHSCLEDLIHPSYCYIHPIQVIGGGGGLFLFHVLGVFIYYIYNRCMYRKSDDSSTRPFSASGAGEGGVWGPSGCDL